MVLLRVKMLNYHEFRRQLQVYTDAKNAFNIYVYIYMERLRTISLLVDRCLLELYIESLHIFIPVEYRVRGINREWDIF